MTSPQPETELQKLEAIPSEILAWLKHIAQSLHIIHATLPAGTPPLPAPPSTTTTDVSSAGNDPTVLVELTPEMAKAPGGASGTMA